MTARTPTTLQNWDDRVSHEDDVHELVAGVPTMPPGEIGRNIDAAMRIRDILAREVGERFHILPGYGVRTTSDVERPTVRQPDLVVLPRSCDLASARVEASEVELAVEVVSPSSIERDWITKRAEYAAAGIPAYLVVDVTDADSPHLVLFELVDGAYPDPPSPTDDVTIRLADRRIRIGIDDLRRHV